MNLKTFKAKNWIPWGSIKKYFWSKRINCFNSARCASSFKTRGGFRAICCSGSISLFRFIQLVGTCHRKEINNRRLPRGDIAPFHGTVNSQKPVKLAHYKSFNFTFKTRQYFSILRQIWEHFSWELKAIVSLPRILVTCKMRDDQQKINNSGYNVGKLVLTPWLEGES